LVSIVPRIAMVAMWSGSSVGTVLVNSIRKNPYFYERKCWRNLQKSALFYVTTGATSLYFTPLDDPIV
jgi:hypothetical protein